MPGRRKQVFRPGGKLGDGMQARERKGTRCHICTGCGRCAVYQDDLAVVADGGLLKRWQDELAARRSLPQHPVVQRSMPQSSLSQGSMPQSPLPQGLSAQEDEDLQEASGSVWVAAADIGTTTIAMVLYDGWGRERDRFVTVNPQTRFGADVVSRIQASSDQKVCKELCQAVQGVLREGIRRFKEDSGQTARLRLAITGNTTMLYLLRGLDPRELGTAPFCASHLEMVEATCGDLDVVLMPGLSAFVGADILAGIYACGMVKEERLTLFLDLGTNGEMALGNRDRIIASSTAAGPAFEGGATKGIWGADMVGIMVSLLREKCMDEMGLLADPYFEEGIRIGGTVVQESQIRQFQLAKAAIAAGMETLAARYGLDGLEGIDRVVLAGGFGTYLQADDACLVGLLPKSLLQKVESAGNAALAGAFRYAFFDWGKQEELEQIKEKVTIVNLAQEGQFGGRYFEAMDFREWE